MMVGLLPPTAGEILIGGRPIGGYDRRALSRRIQMVFQDPTGSLNPRRTVRRTLEAPLAALRGLDQSARTRRIEELMGLVGLRADFADRYPHEFSGGQAQRIGIARALAAEADILVLDEPVSALDVSVQAQVLALLQDLQRRLGLSYVFISHDLAVVDASLSCSVAGWSSSARPTGSSRRRATPIRGNSSPRIRHGFRTRTIMRLSLESDQQALGQHAALLGSTAIRDAIAAGGHAAIVLATGASQFEMLEALCQCRDIDWSRVTAFHLDEYIDLPDTHPASFRRYLRERFLAHVPGIGAFHLIDGNAADVGAELARLNALIAPLPIDVVFAGIGENSHLAFNDPPADFDAEEGFKVVTLDEACRRQQLGEGWFPTLDAVPHRAISMTIRQIMRGQLVVLSVSGDRKAVAVRDAVEGPVTPLCPASILQQHPNCYLFLDPAAARHLTKGPESRPVS
jgi:glucosamine-6-phosphate deaminase